MACAAVALLPGHLPAQAEKSAAPASADAPGTAASGTTKVPGFAKEEFFRFVADSTAVELQNYSDCAIYALKPAHCVVMTGITY